ncbi:MAG: TonB-dependent receptor [Bacteroidota bacterium]
MKTQRFFILLASVLFTLGGYAQTRITGTVTDKSGETLPGTRVYLEDTYDGTTTDAEGRFLIETTEEGDFVLKAEFMEYAPYAAPVRLNGLRIERDIVLKQSFSEVKAVTITAGAFEASDRKQAVILDAIDMVTTAGSNGDVFGALQSLPGTSTVGESGRLFVRGGSGRETQTFIDGNLVYRPFTSSPPSLAVRGRFNPFMFKGTIFSTGGYSAEYGQALSSVLLLETNELAVEDELNIGLLNVGGDVAGNKVWKGGALTGSFNYLNLGPYMGLVPQNLDWNQAPTSLGGQLNFRQKTGKSGLLKFYGNYNRAEMDMNYLDPGTGETAYGLDNANLFLNGAWKTILNEKWAVQTGGSFTRNRDAVGFSGNAVQEDLVAGHGKAVVTWAPARKLKVRMGGEYYQHRFDLNYREANDSVHAGYQEQRIASFAEVDLYASEKLVFRVGGRLERSTYQDRWDVSPRMAAAYKVNDHSQFSLAYGQFHQDAEEQILLYTNQLRPERADHYMLNYQYHKDDRSFRTEAYYKRYRDLVTFNDAPFFSPAAYGNDGRGYAYGLDLFWRDRKTIKNGDYWISYSFIQTEREHRNFPEMATPSFVSTHNLSVVYKHFIPAWRSLPGATFTYGSPRRYDDPNTAAFNDAQMPAFLSLDLNWTYLHRENVIFHVAVSNVPGFRQQFGYRYAAQPDASGQYAATEILPAARRMFVVGCFITLSHNDKNQLDKIN